MALNSSLISVYIHGFQYIQVSQGFPLKQECKQEKKALPSAIGL